MTIRRALGTLTPIVYFVAATPDVEGRHNILLAPYTSYPTPPGHTREEADTLAKVDALQRRLQEQEIRKLRAENLAIERASQLGRLRVYETLRARMLASDTSPMERDFIEAYLALREEKREANRRRWEEAQCYLHVREMDLGSRAADSEEVNLDKLGAK